MNKEDILNKNSNQGSEDAAPVKKRARNLDLRTIMAESDSPGLYF